jgi:hypothetical protein
METEGSVPCSQEPSVPHDYRNSMGSCENGLAYEVLTAAMSFSSHDVDKGFRF